MGPALSLLSLLLLPWPGLAADPPLPDNPLTGRLLFESKRCNECHDVVGAGVGIGPSLGEGRFSGSFLDLGAALWNHVPGMSVSFETTEVPWPELSPGEAKSLLAFLYFIDYLGRPGVAVHGQRIFDRRGCATCHGVGAGGKRVGPDLAGLTRFASPLYVAREIWNHGPAMFETMRDLGMRVPTFDEGDLADLSAFIRQEATTGPQQSLLLSPGNPNLGRELFVRKGCAICHGEAADGARGGADLTRSDLHRSAEGLAATMWNHASAMQEVMNQRGVRFPTFETRELADLLAFLYFLPFEDPPGNRERGREAFAARGCAGCHSGGGGTEHQGPDLAGIEASGSPAALVASMWSHAPFMKEAILGAGLPWPELTGGDLRNLLAFLEVEK